MAFIKLGNRNVAGQPMSDTVDLTDYALIDDVRRPAAPFQTSFTDIPATGNSVLDYAAPRRPTISVRATITGETGAAARAKLRELIGIVSFTAPKSLEFEDDGGLYYMVVPTGARTVRENIDSLMVELSFESLYPWLLGQKRTMQVSGSGSTSLAFGGTYRTPLSVPNQRVATDSSGVWGFTWSTREWSGSSWSTRTRQFGISGLSASATVSVTLDAESMMVRAGGYLVTPRPGSVWPETDRDGNIAISSVIGASSFNVTAVPRWL